MARILILTQAYVPDPSTTGQHLHDAATALVERGHEVRVLAANRGYEDPSRKYPSRETRDGVKIRRIPLSSFGKGSIFVRVVGALSLATQSVVRGAFLRKPDAILVSTHPPPGPITAVILSLLRGIPICYWVHDLNPDLALETGIVGEDTFPVYLMNWLNRQILHRAKRIVVLDRFMAERVQRKQDVAAKVAIIPPWPHNDHAESIKHADNPWRKKYIGKGCRVVMFSGNHSLAHPLDTLLQAALRMRDEDEEDIEYLFIGGGLGKREIEAIIEQEHPRNIRSLPYQSLETLRYSLSAADVHIVSVGNETVGIVHPSKIYGAMAAGRPILLLGPNRCHATDIIGGHNIGWHVTHGNVDGAMKVLRAIQRTPRERLEEMGRTARELVRCHYSRDALRNRFCDEVEAVLPPAAGRLAVNGKMPRKVHGI